MVVELISVGTELLLGKEAMDKLENARAVCTAWAFHVSPVGCR